MGRKTPDQAVTWVEGYCPSCGRWLRSVVIVNPFAYVHCVVCKCDTPVGAFPATSEAARAWTGAREPLAFYWYPQRANRREVIYKRAPLCPAPQKRSDR